MQNENRHELALLTFKSLCDNLDDHHWKYSKDEEQLTIECGVQGDDLPMDLTIEVDEGRQLVLLLSHQPFVTPEDKRIDMAVAVSVVNNRLVDGCFDYDIRNGHMFFRMVCSFKDSVLGDDLFSYLIGCSCQTIDDYNDKFMMLSTGLIDVEKFMEIVNA